MKHAVQHLQLRQPNDKKNPQKNKYRDVLELLTHQLIITRHTVFATLSALESELDLTGLGTDPSLSTGERVTLLTPNQSGPS